MKNRIRFKYSILVVFGMINFNSMAQEDGAYYVSEDFSSWTSATFQLKPSKTWSFSLTEQLRLMENSSALGLLFTELEIGYKHESGFNFGVGYRLISDKGYDSENIDWEQRFHGDIGYKYKLKRFDFSARLRAQSRDDLGEKRVADGDYGRRALRFKLEAEYHIKNWKLDPVVSAEIFRSNGKYETASFSKFRTTIGTSYDFKKAGEISLFYRYQIDLNNAYGMTDHIVGLKYKFTYKTYKKNEYK